MTCSPIQVHIGITRMTSRDGATIKWSPRDKAMRRAWECVGAALGTGIGAPGARARGSVGARSAPWRGQWVRRLPLNARLRNP
jgi:hypothetical protein